MTSRTAKARPLTPDARDVLAACTVGPNPKGPGWAVTLPPRQLDRKLYVEVNETLTRIAGGGTWNRGAKAHLFDRDPGEDLAAVVDSGVMPEDADRLASWWPTPPELADYVADYASLDGLREADRVLEPSAGEGALLAACRRRNPMPTYRGIEPDIDRADKAIALGFHVVPTTFESWLAARSGEVMNWWERVVMNPPFTIPGDANAWLTHVELALQRLAPRGRLVAIVPRSVEHRQGGRFDRLRRIIADRGHIERCAEDAFRSVGTLVRTNIIVVDAGDDPFILP